VGTGSRKENASKQKISVRCSRSAAKALAGFAVSVRAERPCRAKRFRRRSA
jgi:hypothetical protein